MEVFVRQQSMLTSAWPGRKDSREPSIPLMPPSGPTDTMAEIDLRLAARVESNG
jgi:hypothetical protein